MKNMVFKNLFTCSIAILIAATFSSTALAGTVYTDGDQGERAREQQNKIEEPYFYAFSEGDLKYSWWENPDYPKANDTMNLPMPKKIFGTEAVGYELGITLAKKAYDVYASEATIAYGAFPDYRYANSCLLNDYYKNSIVV